MIFKLLTGLAIISSLILEFRLIQKTNYYFIFLNQVTYDCKTDLSALLYCQLKLTLKAPNQLSINYQLTQIKQIKSTFQFLILLEFIIITNLLIAQNQQAMLNKGAQSLPQKDVQAYKQLAKLHDSKNYKKGIKHAEKLLQSHPDHPETLSMKALFQLGLNQQNKALQTAKVALMKSKMKSMFCWHTMGTIYKAKRDYFESSKCFQNAYKFQPQNIQLLKDIGAMQIQVRDHSANVQTRLLILNLKPNLIHNWVGFTVANHLKGDFDSMFKSFKSLDTLLLAADLKPIELSHFYVYKAVACRDAQRYDLMYESLHKNKEKIKDQVLWYQLCLAGAIKLNKPQQAKNYIDFLLKKFPQNVQYMQTYKKVHKIQTNKDLYRTIHQNYKSKIAKFRYVSCLSDKQEFSKEFSVLIKPYYQKNLVSLFAQIQIIYESQFVKREWIQQILTEFNSSLQSKQQYPDGTQAISPSEYLWSMYILAQHHSMRFQTFNKALEFINKALVHTCTVSEFYLVKADIQYKMHKNIQSLNTLNEARKTDLADRYMNNICVKQLFRCKKPTTAEQVMKLFMREDSNVYELQNHWYIIEAGKSFLKLRNFDAGLRHFNFISKQFADMQANQFDFHYYCVRKWTLRQYTELVAFNDNIFADKKYVEAAGYAIKYLREYVHFLKSEEQIKKQTQEKEAAEKAKKKNKKKKNKQPEVEQLTPLQAFRKKIDYFGKQFRQTVGKNPMQEALNWSKNLVSSKFINKQNHNQNRLYAKANIQAILVFIHFDKPLLVLKSFKKFLSANPQAFDAKITTLRVLTYFERYLGKNDANQISKEILNQFIGDKLGNKSSKVYHQQIVSQFKAKNSYLSAIKILESNLIAQNIQSRQNQINLYRSELNQLIEKPETVKNQLQLVLYLVHQLQYFGQFTAQHKNKLNELFVAQTSYFTNWTEAIDKLPDSTWSMWWLSEYDIAREELDNAEAEAIKGNEIKT